MLGRLIKNSILGYILGFTFVGYGFFWLVTINTPWVSGIAGAIVAVIYGKIFGQISLNRYFLMQTIISLTGFMGLILMITFEMQSMYPIGPISTGVGIILLFLLKE